MHQILISPITIIIEATRKAKNTWKYLIMRADPMLLPAMGVGIKGIRAMLSQGLAKALTGTQKVARL